jgi:hypothetical protein
MTAPDWQPIETAPKDGARLRLGNERDASSMRVDSMFKVTGVFERGRWQLNAFFTVPGGRYGAISVVPTHWLPDSTPLASVLS